MCRGGLDSLTAKSQADQMEITPIGANNISQIICALASRVRESITESGELTCSLNLGTADTGLAGRKGEEVVVQLGGSIKTDELDINSRSNNFSREGSNCDYPWNTAISNGNQ